MTQLHQLLAARVKDWRDSGYPSAAYPALAEVLEYQVEAETGAPRFLRLAQLRALETYWYLRPAAPARRKVLLNFLPFAMLHVVGGPGRFA